MNNNQLRAFFNAIPLPSAVLRIEGNDYIFEEVNEAYLKLTDSKREDLLGNHIFDLFPQNGDEEAVKGQRDLETIFKNVLETGEPDSIDVMRYDVKNKHSGRFEERYWALEIIPSADDDGQITHFFHTVREITNRVLTEKKEREIRKKYQKLLQSVNVIVWEAHVAEFRHTYVSPQTEDILGYKADEWLQEEDFWANHIHPDDRENAVRYCREMSEAGQDHELEYRMITADGREVWVKDIITVDGEGTDRYIRGVLIDITHQKRLEEDLNHLLRKVQERVKEQECLYKITDLGLKGIPVDKTLLKSAVYIKHGFQYPLITEVQITLGDEAFQTRNYRETEWKLSESSKLSDGTFLSIDVCYQKEMSIENDVLFLQEEEAMLSIVIKTLAATIEKQKAFNVLKTLNRNLEWKTKELERSNKELEEFAFATSNELQEPLRMINSFLKQLERKYGDRFDDKARQYIKFSVDGARRMRQVILDLLEFSRMGDPGRDPEPVDLNKLLEDVKLSMKRKLEQNHAEITVNLLPVIPGFKDELKVLFQNLLENAITYHKENSSPEILIHTEERDLEWIIHVSDNGLGIDPVYHDKIFNVFQRLHSYEEQAGTGIGLSICKKIAMMHGGEIWVESEEGRGSTFSFSVDK